MTQIKRYWKEMRDHCLRYTKQLVTDVKGTVLATILYIIGPIHVILNFVLCALESRPTPYALPNSLRACGKCYIVE